MDKLFLLVSLVAVATAAAAREDHFLISHWCGPDEATPEKIKLAAGANFNVIMFGGTVEQNKLALDLCESEGVRALIIDNRVMAKRPRERGFAANLDAVVADYGSHPALWDYFLQDEPNASDFRRLAAVNKYLLKKDPRHVPFINLFPTYATRQQLGSPTYEQHVDEFCRVVQPRLLSCDHYALLADGERPDYFENLEIIRRQSIKHRVPFNYILLSVPHGPYRDPTEADLRWQVNTALAYGARGLMYFTYMTPNDPNWKFRSGIIGADGNPTAKYEQVRHINAELLRLAPTLIRLRSVAVYHTGELPRGTKALPEGGLISRVDGGELVVGQFDSDTGQKYAMLVNRTPERSVRAAIRFSQQVALWQVHPATGRERSVVVSEEDGNFIWRVTLKPGEGRLVRIETPRNLPVLHWDDTPKFRPRVMLNPSCQFGNVIRDENGNELYNEGVNMYDIALKVRDELVRDGRVEVFVSRASREQDVSLRCETELTRSLNCDALVSLHSDATADGTPGGGTWTFYADEGEG
ncbi:MAG: N-acetylmuramoyl-L-alanine amidase, partial [Armatimonadota bacterium]